MRKKAFSAKILMQTKHLGMLIAVLIFTLILLADNFTDITNKLKLKMIDVNFYLKNISQKTYIQEGVTQSIQNPNISSDILIVGIDFRSLNKFGKWPFPRYRHADLIKTFSRIKNQEERERAVFIDIFFIEPDTGKAYDDALLVEAIKENGRVFLETVLDEVPPSEAIAEDYIGRQEILYNTYGRITNVKGNWHNITSYPGLQPPLQPLARASKGYGHANFKEDFDKIYRRQGMISKSSILIDVINIDDLTADYKIDETVFERLGWTDKNGKDHPVSYPLSDEQVQALKETVVRNSPPVKTQNEGGEESYYYTVKKYKDTFVPAITLSLALEYFNKRPEDIEVVVGQYVKIPSPEYFDLEKQEWVPYQVVVKPAKYSKDGTIVRQEIKKVLDEVVIPIDENGQMLINFMGNPSTADPGGHQTYPIRSYSGYAAKSPPFDSSAWPKTMALANKILMTGPFARGIAADEKTTPYGLMYGVEIHANALNTILMNKFLKEVPAWINIAILFVLVMCTAFLTSRLSTHWAAVFSFFSILVFFISTSIIFDSMNYIVDFAPSAVGVFFTFLSIVVYRVMTEEKDKKRIKNMFGKYVSPAVVDQILENPPELGGVDKNLTVFFSDIRGFTTLSETMTPQELVNHLNIYLTAMTDIILELRGTLDKYVGDEIMCFWGAPLPQEDHALLACKCALKQMDALRKLNEGWPPEKRINIGIGLNSGIMTVGNMGSLGRMNYTLMGDNVNLGARLEGTNKQYGTQIIISEFTYPLVKDKAVVRELDNIRVKGKNKPVLIYELLDIKGGYDTL
ncbi:MAG: adenylate/guanylate cyclase domain-containing protein [Spirochaetia bacterium]|jgi:adenylate cyclase|nr:adenylate/guanylate cyclase domain-containing protein [Spirochaetia bacterium]